METKVCKTCKIEKPFIDFHKNKSTKDGMNSACKICKKKSDKKSYEKNLEKRKAKNKEYYERNREMKIRWYLNNREKVYSNVLKRKSNKHHVRVEGFRRYRILDRDNWTCQKCKVKVHDRKVGGKKNRHLWDDEFKAHIDHIIPISKGGHSTSDNLQVLCRTCNLSKSNKIEQEK